MAASSWPSWWSRQPYCGSRASRRRSAAAPIVPAVLGCALLFPLAQTVVSSADGTPPFFGRLMQHYRRRRSYVRGAVLGLGVALAFLVDLQQRERHGPFRRHLRAGCGGLRGCRPPVRRCCGAARPPQGDGARQSLRARGLARRPRRGRARLVFRRQADRGRGHQVLGLCRSRLRGLGPPVADFSHLPAVQQIRRDRPRPGRRAARGCSSTNRCPA